jgi:uroporphyrinogen-III synthase
MRVIVTRPQREAQQWVQALTESGYDTWALPLIDVLPAPFPEQVIAAWRRLASFDAVMFVSGNAVDQFFALKPDESLAFTDDRAIKTRAFVTGPGSLSALMRAKVSRTCIDMPDTDAGQFDSEALWKVVSPQLHPGYRVLIVRGTTQPGIPEALAAGAGEGVGRDWFADQVRAAAGTVEFVVAYQRRMPDWSASEQQRVREAAADGSAWLFSSSEAISNLLCACPGQDWSQARAVVTHSRIAQAARAAGFGVVCESRPALGALMASIESLG